ncbi:DJ-1/PfpI family protein [Ferruginibacter sp. SUN106]|uniref:DJ-1/PfpI family protein n=1 Tax=Ferruginibacter sp. SUN106 TaxID=2978348 RepID=UPI003D36C8BC
MTVAVLLFNNFETLDAFGPVEIFGRLTDQYQVSFYSLAGGLIGNAHGVSVMTKNLAEIENGSDIFLIPGGYGTREEVNNALLIDMIRKISQQSKYVLTVCTGTSLLAKTGLLDGKNATSNKIAFDWVTTQGPNVTWVRRARWVVDGKYYTSSGVSAGMDMTLGFLENIHGIEFARNVARTIEYNWQENKEEDSFCTQ